MFDYSLKAFSSILSILFYRVLLWLVLNEATASITRLECRFHGSFNIRKIDKKYNHEALKIYENVDSAKSCTLLCVLFPSCDTINYNMQELLCELIQMVDNVFYETKLNNAANWNFSATKFNRKNVRSFDDFLYNFSFAFCSNKKSFKPLLCFYIVLHYVLFVFNEFFCHYLSLFVIQLFVPLSSSLPFTIISGLIFCTLKSQ